MKIKCPACAKILTIPESAAGKVVKCPCGKQLRAPGSATSVSADNSTASTTPARSGQPASRPTPGPAAIDPGIFDDLTENDLQPVKAASNPYQTPLGASSSQANSAGSNVLAKPGIRIGAVLLDGLFYILLTIPGFVLSFGLFAAMIVASGETSGDKTNLNGGDVIAILILLLGMFLPTVINAILISKSGQTIGKKMVGIRMVDQNTGQPAGFLQGFLLRSLVFQLITGLPAIGFLIALADIFFLFTEGHQTLHDRLAKTRVVVV